MTTMLRSRLCLRDAAKRVSTLSSHHLRVRGPPLARIRAPVHQLQQHAYYSSDNSPPRSKASTEFPKNVDVDELEKKLKDLTGDHATWDHEKLKKLVYNDRLVPPEDVFHSGDYFNGGMLPGGSPPSYPLMTKSETELYSTPYQAWAAPPYNALPESCMERVMSLYLGPGGEPFWARLHVLRKKLWHGMVPLSRERWLEKKLDDPKNYRMFMNLMEDINTIFHWLNNEKVQGKMRDNFNAVVDAFVEFEGAANLRRDQMGVKERLDMAGMWAEYFQAILSTMSERTYRWLEDRVEEIQTRAFSEYTQAIEDHRGDAKAIGLASREYYECVQDLNAMMTRADYTLGVPMTGFKGYTASNNLSDLSIEHRHEAWRRIADTKDWRYTEQIGKARQRESADKQKDILDYVGEMKNGPKPAAPHFEDPEPFIGHYSEGRRNRVEISKMLRGEPKPLGEEYWITILKERMEYYATHGRSDETWNQSFGFVCYRLTYRQTDAEWADFLDKFHAHACISGDWIQGYDSIADKAGIHIIDGRDIGIAEGDIEAAKKHFKETYTMLPTLGRLWTSDFLVVDAQSYESHVNPLPEEKRPPPPYGPCFGDNGGFVRLVDTMEYSREVIDVTSPGYTGQMRVLSSLLLGEVYPLLATNALRPLHMWPLARLHPGEVYVGHTVGAQEYWWEFNRIDKVAVMQHFMEHLRKGKAKLGEKK